MEEFPAAHSMDTTWFAVDRDGHVAVFDTGEAGALPDDATGAEDAEDAVRQLPRTGMRVDADAFRTHIDGHAAIREGATQIHIFALVREVDAIRDLMPRLGAIEQLGTTSNCILVTSGPEAFAELHVRDACLGCHNTWYGFDRDVAHHGVYHFRHSYENWIAGPYARLCVPNQPVSIDDMPQAVREAALRFEGRFAEWPTLQPAEHWPSHAHSEGWLASDGKTIRSLTTGEILDDDNDDVVE